MLDDRDDEADDVVTKHNELTWRKKFSEDSGHSMECVRETVEEMAELVAKVCSSFGGLPVEKVIEQIGVEEFDVNLRAILNGKKCDCK